MKKILLFISSFMLFVSGIKAEVKYSDWVTELDPNIEYEDVIEEKRYRFYKENKIGKYISINNNLESDYEYIDYENFIISDYSDWVMELDLNKEYYEIDTSSVYPYKKVGDTSYIHLFAFSHDVSFNNIKVYESKEEIEYEFINCENCTDDYENVHKGEKIILKLDKTVDTSKISLYLKVNPDHAYKSYSIGGSSDEDNKYKTFGRVVSINKINYIPDKIAVAIATKFESMYSKERIESDIFTTVYEPIIMHRYKEKLVFHYNIEREYYDDNYYVDIPNYIKDEENYKIYYKYLVKEYIDDNSSKNNNIFNIEAIKENVLYETDDISEETSEYNITIENDRDIINKIKEKEINKLIEIADNKSHNTNIISPLKIDNKIHFVKYVILVVIILTIIYIYYQNKKCQKK